MKKVDLVNAVVAETGMKPAQVRKVMDSALGVMKRSLESGVEVAAAPLGRLRAVNVGEGESARTVYRLSMYGVKAAPRAQAAPASGKAEKKRGWFGKS